jgi:hypothetical protein
LFEKRLVSSCSEAFSRPVGTLCRFPCRHGLDRPLRPIKNFFEDAAFHVGANRQAEPMEDRRCDIEESGTENELVSLKTRAASDEDTLRPVPDSDSGRDTRRELGT